jgi:tRNA pseudouridine38-40 synthase
MPRYKLTIEYNGNGTIGWQKQEGELSIQMLLEGALAGFCEQPVEAVAAGRTDAGVHALAQVVHVDLPRAYDTYSIMQGLNFHLYMQTGNSEETRSVPKVAVIEAQAVSDEFHARFSATKRHYVYRILTRRARPVIEAGRVWHVPEELDLKAMQAAAAQLVGHHDFSSFRDAQCQSKSPIKTLDEFRVERISPEEIRCSLSSRSFLHHQVRILVGTLRWVGNGKLKPSDIPAILSAKNRASAGPTAVSDGLYLVGVEYANG